MFNHKKRRTYYDPGYPMQIVHGNPLQNFFYSGVIRNHPYPYPTPLQNPEWHSYQPQNPYYPQQYQPINNGYQPFSQPQPTQSAIQKDSQFLFKNPLQPQEEMLTSNPYYPPVGNLVNPYPKPNLMVKQPGGMQSIMNSFKSQDGSVDFNKMMNAAGQMMNAVTQVTSLVKGLGSMFKL